MFEYRSGTRSIRTLTVLTSVALAALLTPQGRSIAQAQPYEMTLSSPDDQLPLFRDANVLGAIQSVGGPEDLSPSWAANLESKEGSGFLTGLPGYEDFVMPVGMPMYFEDPFITTDMRLLYMHHDIPSRSALGNGQIHVVASQIRLALSERTAFMVTKGGYSWVDSRATSAGDGWNDWAIGLKHALYSNPERQLLVTAGLRWEMTNGSSDAWQGGNSGELSPFVSMAKGWEKWHFLGAVSGRLPTNRSAGNTSVVWNLHLDYELTENFRPLIELNGIHYLSSADEVSLGADYLDVGSLGATDVTGRDFFSAGFGFRWQAAPNVSVGLTFEVPLESTSENLQEHRITLNTVVSF